MHLLHDQQWPGGHLPAMRPPASSPATKAERGCFPMWRKHAQRPPLLRMLRHRTPTSTVPMLRTLENSRPFIVLYFWEFRDFSRMHRWIHNEPKYPQSFVFTRWAGYLKIALYGKRYTLLYTSAVIWTFSEIFCAVLLFINSCKCKKFTCAILFQRFCKVMIGYILIGLICFNM